MRSATSKIGIRCPINLFEPQEAKIEALTKGINAARKAPEKMRHASELMDEVGVLLQCPRYDRTNSNCDLCRNFSELRAKTANLIVKAGARAAP
jgi:hypothetical protein